MDLAFIGRILKKISRREIRLKARAPFIAQNPLDEIKNVGQIRVSFCNHGSHRVHSAMPYPLFPLTNAASSRRSFLRGAASLAAAALCSSCATTTFKRVAKFPTYPFTLGVASGDPGPDGFVLWTRLAPLPLEGGGMPDEAVEVSWIVAEDEQLSRVVASGREIARPEWGHSVHVEVTGLKPERWYWYQFKCGSDTSPLARSRTTPLEGTVPEKLRFAFASCQHYETGYYTAYEHMIREDLDLIIHLGDYIYENRGRFAQVRRHVDGEAMTVDDYRNRHAQYKSDPALQAAHAAVPWILTWDDHEVDNNYAGAISERLDVSPEQFLLRRAAAYQAYYEHMPLRRSSIPNGPDMQMFRRISFGKLAEFFVLDTRQYRTDQPCGDGIKPPCPESMSPEATLLGAAQREWLLNGLAQSGAHWNVLAQQVMMARVDREPGRSEKFCMDQWPGYEIERRYVLQQLRDRKILNPVVLTGDVHSNWANELTLHSDLDFKSPVAAEFVGTSITSEGDGRRFPANLRETLAENPFVKFYNAERGYVKCEISPKQWRTDYRTVEFVEKRDAPMNTRATFSLDSGSSVLNRIS
jgi:alkaline phosphatase D